MFKLGLKSIKGHDYVYAQESIYLSREKTKTKSYSLGGVKEFIAKLNVVLNKGKVFTHSGEMCISKIAEKIGFFKCVNKYVSKKWGYKLPNYLLTLVTYQILSPDSKSQCREWYQNSYMQYIVKLPEIAFHKNNIYEYMDKFYKKQHKIFRSLRDAAISKIGINISELIFDTTSVFFRVAEFTVDDVFRRYGNSKDKRPDLIQVVLAVCTNGDGFPLYYRAYPGNTSDFHAFKNFLHDFDTEIKPIHKGGVVWIIFDKGNTSKKTILKLDQISESFPRDSYLAYLASIKLNEDMLNELKYADTCQIDEQEYKVAEMFAELYGGVKRVLIVYDPKLKSKQVVKMEKKFQAVISELYRIQRNEKDKVKCITKMSAIIRKNKLTAIFKVKETDKGIVYEEDKSAKERKLMKARTFAVITNNFTSSKSDIVHNYIGRNRVEQTIWELKNLIPIRPIFHHLKRRIKTHAFLVMLGYLLLSTTKIFLKKKGLNMTMEKLLSVIRSGYVEIIEWSNSITIEYPKNVSNILEKIYEKFEIPILKI